jgi:uncharacterized YceG family protein
MSRTIRRRRIVAAVLFLAVAAGVAAVSAVALRHHHHAAAPPPPPPPPKPFRVVFPEGFTRAQMAVRVRDVAKIAERERHHRVGLNGSAYLAGSGSGVVKCLGAAPRKNLEGFLFPATYDFFTGTTSKALIREQLQTFCRHWTHLNLKYARSKNLTPYDVLTIASMVEREAQVPSERKLIAAVIYNRLRDRMPLGIDATLRYGLHIPPTQSITQSELASDNPYNTRHLPGLPPTPIANPGLASIRAAAHPAHVDYLYFVRKPDHRHHFFTASAAAFDQYLATHGYS